MNRDSMKKVTGFLVVVFGGALLTMVYWPLLIVAGIMGGYLIEDTKKAVTAFVGGVLSWSLLFLRYAFSGHFGAVNSFINAVAGIPALPLTLVVGGVLALLGALIGVTAKKILRK